MNTKRIEELERMAEEWGNRLVWLQEEGSPEEPTAAWEREVAEAYAIAQGAEDEVDRLKASALLADPAFAAHVVATLPSPPAGPDEIGSPMVWTCGREFWADEVQAAWLAFQAAEAAA